MNLSELVQDFRDNVQKSKADDLAWIKGFSSIQQAITLLAMARMRNGKKYPHQWRQSDSVMAKGRDLLLSNKDALRDCQDFEELLELIESLVMPIRGLKEMYAYDTAFRIGVFLRKMPQRVHLHRGVRVGAQALGFDPNRRAIEMSELPAELQALEPHEVEDFLCIYKDELGGGDSAASGCRVPSCGPGPRVGRSCG